MIALILFLFSVEAHQIAIVCDNGCEKTRGYLVVTDKEIHVRIEGTETFEIKGKVKSHGKTFYRLEDGWLVIKDQSAILSIGREVIKYKFKYNGRK